MVWYDNIHGLSVHLHTGILVLALFTALFCIIIRLITFLYPRWGLIRGIFSDWDFTKNIYKKRDSIFRALDYTTLICIMIGIIGLVIGMITGSNAINWDYSGMNDRAKLVLSMYALIFYGVALIVRGFFRKMWRNPGLIIIYGLCIGFGFFFIFITAALGGLMTYGESIAEQILVWLREIGFFRLFGIEGITLF